MEQFLEKGWSLKHWNQHGAYKKESINIASIILEEVTQSLSSNG